MGTYLSTIDLAEQLDTYDSMRAPLCPDNPTHRKSCTNLVSDFFFAANLWRGEKKVDRRLVSSNHTITHPARNALDLEPISPTRY